MPDNFPVRCLYQSCSKNALRPPLWGVCVCCNCFIHALNYLICLVSYPTKRFKDERLKHHPYLVAAPLHVPTRALSARICLRSPECLTSSVFQVTPGLGTDNRDVQCNPASPSAHTYFNVLGPAKQRISRPFPGVPRLLESQQIQHPHRFQLRRQMRKLGLVLQIVPNNVMIDSFVPTTHA